MATTSAVVQGHLWLVGNFLQLTAFLINSIDLARSLFCLHLINCLVSINALVAQSSPLPSDLAPHRTTPHRIAQNRTGR